MKCKEKIFSQNVPTDQHVHIRKRIGHACDLDGTYRDVELRKRERSAVNRSIKRPTHAAKLGAAYLGKPYSLGSLHRDTGDRGSGIDHRLERLRLAAAGRRSHGHLEDRPVLGKIVRRRCRRRRLIPALSQARAAEHRHATERIHAPDGNGPKGNHLSTRCTGSSARACLMMKVPGAYLENPAVNAA